MKELRTELAANTATTASVKSSTQELVELLHSVKGAFTVLEMIGKLARPLAFLTALVVAVGTLISSFKTGGHP